MSDGSLNSSGYEIVGYEELLAGLEEGFGEGLED